MELSRSSLNDGPRVNRLANAIYIAKTKVDILLLGYLSRILVCMYVSLLERDVFNTDKISAVSASTELHTNEIYKHALIYLPISHS